MKQKFEFRVKLTAGDLWHFTMYHAYSGMTGVFCVIFTLVAVVLILTRWNVLETYQKGLLVICLLLFTIWQPGLLYYKACKQAKRPAIAAPMELTFSRSEGLRVRQNGQSARFAWDQIGRVDRHGSMLIIYLDRIHAYLLPKTVLGEDEESFYGLLKDCLPQGHTRGI